LDGEKKTKTVNNIHTPVTFTVCLFSLQGTEECPSQAEESAECKCTVGGTTKAGGG